MGSSEHLGGFKKMVTTITFRTHSRVAKKLGLLSHSSAESKEPGQSKSRL